MNINKEEIDIENPFNNFKLFWKAGKESWKQKENIVRLTAFYSKYHPSKLNSISSLLSKYEGRELEMYNNIYKKYGVDALSPADRTTLENGYIITEFYKVHNKDKTGDVSELLKKYSEDIELLFKKLEKKYGIDPRKEIELPFIVESQPQKMESSESEGESSEEKPSDVKDTSTFFSSIYESSKKFISGIASGLNEEPKKRVVKEENAKLGGKIISEDRRIQNQIKERSQRILGTDLVKTDDSLSLLSGLMKDEEQLWSELQTEAGYDHCAFISSYQTRLNAILERVKTIEYVLISREEEMEREALDSWKEGKRSKVEELKRTFIEKMEEKEEELKSVRMVDSVDSVEMKETTRAESDDDL